MSRRAAPLPHFPLPRTRSTYKKSRELVATECGRLGLPCKPGYSCVCRPCVPVPKTEVDVFILPVRTIRERKKLPAAVLLQPRTFPRCLERPSPLPCHAMTPSCCAFAVPPYPQGNPSAALGALGETPPPGACQLLKVCLTVTQNSIATVVLRDNLQDARPRADEHPPQPPSPRPGLG